MSKTRTDSGQQMRTRSFSRAPSSVDIDARTFSAVLTSEAPVRTWIPNPDWSGDDKAPSHIEVDEILVTDGVDLPGRAGCR